MNKCPKCKSEDIYWDGYEGDYDCVWQPASCNDCGFSWNEVYMFSHCEETETGKLHEIDENGNYILKEAKKDSG